MPTIVSRIAGGAVLLAACGEPGSREEGVRAVVDTAGAFPTTRVSGEAPSSAAILVASAGVDSSGASDLGSVRSVVLDSRGNVYVVDDRNVQVSTYDSSGRFLANLGRRGRGPGEYLRPYSVALVGDSLALFDPGRSSISLLTLNGEWIREWITPPNTGPQMVRLYRNPPGVFWAYATRRAAGGGLERTFIRYDASGPTDTLPLPVPSAGTDLGIRCTSRDGSFAYHSQPFGFTPIMVPTPWGERVTTVDANYRLVFLGPTGDTLRAIERNVRPAPVTDSLWDVALAEWKAYRTRRPDAFCSRDSFERPAAKPILGMIFFDDVGQMWVEVTSERGLAYDVYSPKGELRTTVRGLPPTSGIEPSVVAGRIAFVVVDSLDQELVQVYRIRAPN